MTRVAVNPELLRWARERAGLVQGELVGKFMKLPDWETGNILPTLKQVETFARTVHVPIGYLFLTEPPEEPVPIPDFRTFAGRAVTRPSPNLLDTIYTCQERQNWYRDFVRVTQGPKVGFVGSTTVAMPPEDVATQMRETLGFDLNAQKKCSTWTNALGLFIQQAEKAGVLVMISGVVMSNNYRSLDTTEFRGFALSDPLAPLIFANGSDTKAAQMFTLAHELAHLWLGTSALSNIGAAPQPGFRQEERWCNAAAAEFMVPIVALHDELRDDELLPDRLSRLANVFKVSKLVILRRLLDANRLDRPSFDAAWAQEHKQLQTFARSGSGGGNFYHTTLSRVSHRFARALVVSTLEGKTLYRDACRMLGVNKIETFNNLGRKIGVMG